MQQLLARVRESWPVRAWQRYTEMRGPVLAQGMTLQAFLSLFAALFVAFAVFMAVLGGNVALRDAVIDSIASSIPGLIGEHGALDVEQLTRSSIVGWAGAVAAASILFTAIAWIGVSREGFRAMFDLGDPPASIVLLKLGDLAVGIGIGLLVVISAAVQVVTQALAGALGLEWTAQLLGVASQLLLDTAVVLLLYRFGGRLRLPAKAIVPTALACAVAFFGLKQVATLLFRGVENNPLLAGIAAPVIILIWLGFIMQILLLALAFVAVSDTGRAYSRLVAMRGIDARLTKERASELLEEVRAARRDGDDPARLHRRLAKRHR
ncbi:YihY/virulence factor BrkB family protein [Agrococcus sp. HG114]|uniref:YihY/virulence factor BrkB family protein n=1 Tax=Agrococcus sp. HG114 TaxID=2969757 RepID=UPI00215A2A20|nr:YihY/virulence factor BrkB family protein [Agrococcus sp. HG114]MCR8669926.1 YihY/virulence factor BrkB family protein [Agrococcus sp. HG114]